MQLGDMFKLAYKALVHRKSRSLLTILGITIGSAIIFALIASSGGLTAGITANIEKTGANIINIRPAMMMFQSGSPSQYQISQLDVNYVNTIPGVIAAYPYYRYPIFINSGGTSLLATLIGVDLNSLPILYNGLTVVEGNMPVLGDTTGAVVGWSIANPISGTPLNVNQMITMTVGGISSKSQSYAVLATGILQQYGTALFANIDDSVFISFQAAQYLAKTQYFSGIYVVVDNTDDVANVQDTMTTYYNQNVRVISSGQILSFIEGITSSLTLFLAGIGAVSLFIATVGIVNTMYVSVTERTREIGIMKAIGYRPKEIMTMFLSEAVLTGVIGAFCGLGVGYALSFLMGGMLSGFGGGLPGGGGPGGITIQPMFSNDLIIFSLVFPIILATLAGLFPAWRGSRMNAVAALRYD